MRHGKRQAAQSPDHHYEDCEETDERKCMCTLKYLDKGLLTPYILMIALSTHAIFEGLAVGVMEEPSQVANLVVAITLHKGAEAMALVGFS